MELRAGWLGLLRRGLLASDVLMDTLETVLKIGVPKTSNQAHYAHIVVLNGTGPGESSG
jgi:hypothetical protein